METITGGGNVALDRKIIQALRQADADEAAARAAGDIALGNRITALETIVANLVNHAILDSGYPSDNS